MTAGDREPSVDQRLQVRPLAGDEDSDQAILPITRSSPGLRHDGAEADPEVEDAAQLLLVDVSREPLEDRRAAPRRSQSISARRPVGDDAREVAEDAAARHVCEGVRAVAQPAYVFEVKARRREQVVALVVLLLEHAAGRG